MVILEGMLVAKMLFFMLWLLKRNLNEKVMLSQRLKSTRVSVKSQASTGVKSPLRTDSSPVLLEIKTASPETLLHSSTSGESSGQSQSKPRSMTVKEQDQSMNWSNSPNCRTGGVTNQNEKRREKGDRCNGGDALTNQKGCALEKCRRSADNVQQKRTETMSQSSQTWMSNCQKDSCVCYTSTSEGPNISVATQSLTDSKTKGRGYPCAPESPVNNLRKHTMSSDHSLLHAAENRAPVDASGRVNCVPVKHIFNQLLAAIG
ncbi:hypothetical protein Leryth_005436 [Lithospermum erythrorhizon]|nr:hypothetical protein Leryth_005436 [Lithospermum erythrorhizon]